MRLNPIRGLVPAAPFVQEVAAVPYDVVDRSEAAALAAGKPHSLLHVDRAEIDLPADVDPYDDAVYARARENFVRLQSEGVLVREPEPAVYFYRQTMGGHSQTGLVAGCHIEDYERDVIKKHEKTRKVKEDDRTRLVDTLSAHTGPVFLTYRDVAAVDAIEREVTSSQAPLFDFVADDGIGHTVWRVTGERATALASLFADGVPTSYVADGHHRSASAARVGGERRAGNPGHTGEEEYNWFLGVLFPATQLKILPYNRAVADLNGHTHASLLAAITAAGFQVAGALGWICAALAILTAYVRELGRGLGQPADFGGPMAKPQRMFALTITGLAAALEPLWGWNGQILLIGLGAIAAGTLITVWRRTRRLGQALRQASKDLSMFR
jgi:uncharacterized protein (DUF1015 family)